MGYSNHWLCPPELPQEQFSAAARDVRVVFRHFGDELAGPSRAQAPIANDDLIAFNGWPLSCESFYFERVQRKDEGDQSSCGWCKTRMLPYDLAVKVVFLVLQHHFGEKFTYSSDGDDAGRWQKARRLCRKLLGYPAGKTVTLKIKECLKWLTGQPFKVLQ